jgi:hypothetical protein
MPRLNALEKAIAQIDEQIKMLQLARAHLVAQQAKPKPARPRVVKPDGVPA